MNKPSFQRCGLVLLSTANRNTQVALVVNNPSANTGDKRDMGLIPGLGRSLEKGTTTHSSILAWRIPWREELGQAPVYSVTKSQTQLKRLTVQHKYKMEEFFKT